jgi:AAHS family 3-hydroxyphenylpropionic acid transporter
MTISVADARSGPAAPAAVSGGLIILLCSLVSILEGFDLQIIGVVGPQIAKSFRLDPEQLGVAFAASLIGLAIGAIAGGRLADRWGRKPLLLLATLLFGVFTLATAAAWNPNSLLALRFLTGLGLGGAMPNVIAIVAESARRDRVTLAVAGMTCGLSVGGILVAQTAHLMATGSGWQSVFLIGGGLPILLLPALFWLLPETCRAAPEDERKVHALRGLFGQGQGHVTIALWLVFGLTLLQLSLLLNWLPSLVIGKGLPREFGYFAATIFNLGGIVGSLLAGALCDRFGARWPMLGCFGLMAIGYVGLSGASSPVALMAACFVCGIAVLGAQYALYGLSPRLYGDGARATGVGAAVAVGRIGAIIGPLLAGGLLKAGAGPGQLTMLQLPLIALAALAMARLAGAAGSRLAAARPSPPHQTR